MKRRFYYTLAVSLPALPHFDQAERLPVTREQLQRRLKMLEEGDAEILEEIESYLFWREQPKKECNEEIIKQYRLLMEKEMPLDLQEFILFFMSERTVLVALRRKLRGFAAPKPGEAWGVGRWVQHIEKNWEDPHFGLAAVYPWIVKVRELLYAGETLELERLILNYAWQKLDRLAAGKDFEFAFVVAYLIKWNIIHYWLSFNPEAARVRFEELVSEAYGEHANFIEV
jgi:hypothetical protein